MTLLSQDTLTRFCQEYELYLSKEVMDLLKTCRPKTVIAFMQRKKKEGNVFISDKSITLAEILSLWRDSDEEYVLEYASLNSHGKTN